VFKLEKAALATHLHSLGGDFDSLYSRAKKDACERDIHRLRVTSRRILALLSAVEVCAGKKRVGHLRKHIKRTLGELGPLRNVQVMKSYLEEAGKDLTPVAPLLTKLEDNEREARKQVKKQLHNKHRRHIKRSVKKLTKRLVESDVAEPRLRAEVRESLRLALDDVGDKQDKLSLADPRAFHQLRLSVKRFRYLYETLGEGSQKEQKVIKDLQNRLGEIQDYSMLLSFLRKEREVPIARNLIRRFSDRRLRLMATFVELPEDSAQERKIA